MKRKVTVRIGTWNRAKEFVKRIDSFDCEFDMEFGKTALEARSLNNLRGLDLSVPQRVLIYGENSEVERAEQVVAQYS